MKMEICDIKSVQRVANFILDDGKMLEVEDSETVMPNVTMLCDLPLLFRNGFPTCLENLTVGELEKFVPYMIRCSGVPTQTKPKWWPDEIYTTTLTKSTDMTDKNWLLYLKRLVLHCYSYHGCEFALKLCADPSHKCRSTKRCRSPNSEFSEENSSTHRYKLPRGMPATRRSAKMCYNLGQYRESVNNPPKKNTGNVHVRNKSPVQIYLCDNCDSEFKTSKEIFAHEKICIEGKICKSSVIPVNTRNSNPYHYTLRNNNESNAYNATSTVSRSGSALFSKIQTVQRCVNSRISLAPKALSEKQSKPSEPCKSCRKLFVSPKLLRDHETICLKQQLLLARFRSSSTSAISPRNFDRRDQHNCQRMSPNTNIPEADTSLPLRRKRMKLLPRKTCQNNSIDLSQRDIFLCDNCDKEFKSFSDVQRHEILGCGMRGELSSTPVPESTEKLPTEENFLRYFNLSPTFKSQPTRFYIGAIPGSISRSKRFLGNPIRYSAIPVSSPLGSLIHGSQVPTSAILTKIEKVERFCQTKPIAIFRHIEAMQDTSEWRISWKLRKNTTYETGRSYTYPLQRWWKMPEVWSTQMKVKRKNMLFKHCKSVQIKLRKLTTRDIELYSACRTVRVIIKKITKKDILLYSNL